MNALKVLNTKTGAVVALAGVAAIGLYVVQNKLSGAIGDAMAPITNGFWSLFQDDAVEFTAFDISRLHRDFFDENWIMLAEPKAMYKRAYPVELGELLTVNGQLKEQYRNRII